VGAAEGKLGNRQNGGRRGGDGLKECPPGMGEVTKKKTSKKRASAHEKEKRDRRPIGGGGREGQRASVILWRRKSLQTVWKVSDGQKKAPDVARRTFSG